MLPEHESRELRKIEEGLRSEDPEFAAAVSRADHADTLRRRAILMLAEITAVVMVAAGMLSGDGWVIFWGLLGGAALAWVHVTRFREPRRPSGRRS
ncbi:DUF3040 domain-containing protein [Amycolatopsis tolypomycina]|uniref:DUF3040 domain-containing protein n=1 Tax=Amycolatopsis tolypomycina TaxID=208445 RepID=UPI0033BD8F6B